jgi:hypothetical protein
MYYFKLKIKCLYFVLTCSHRSRKDKHLFIVPDQPESQALNRSFAELDLYTENTSELMWKFVRNLHHRPYETTLETFSKLTDLWCKYLRLSCKNWTSVHLSVQFKICNCISSEHCSYCFSFLCFFFIDGCWYRVLMEVGAVIQVL